MSVDSAQLAVIRPDRRLEVLDVTHALAWGTRPVETLLWAGWGAASDSDKSLYSWPTWDGTGQRLASFRTPTRGFGPELVVLGAGGVRVDVLLQLDQRIPIYVQWSPDGATLAVLYQEGNRLGLSTVDPQSGDTTDLVRGSPLFFTWADPEHLAVFVGSPEDESRIGLLDIRSREMDRFPGQPGNFCAPISVSGRIAYVAHRSGRLSMWLADRLAARELASVEGLVALLPDPRGGALAHAVAPDDRSPYRQLSRLDLETGVSTLIADRDCTAFFWSPTGQHIVLASTDVTSGIVSFTSIQLHNGQEQHLGDLRPTRDLRFYLRFFEQFAQSHPLIDPDGKAIVLPGDLDRGGNISGLWRVPLDGGPPERLGDGLLGVWGPRMPSAGSKG